MKNHFIIPYSGNKRKEVELIYKYILEKLNLDDIEYIIEPFCGSSALSYYFSTLHPKKFKYILNDNNKHLIALYKLLQDEAKSNDFMNEVITIIETISKEDYNKLIKTDTLMGWYVKSRFYIFRAGVYPQEGYLDMRCPDGKCPDRRERAIALIKNTRFNYPIINFLRNEDIIFKNVDAIKIMEEYKNNNKALILLDPPYLKTCNAFYLCHNLNIYDYLIKNNINDMTAKVFITLEDINEVRDVFKDNYFYDNYDKRYEITHKRTKHVLITQMTF